MGNCRLPTVLSSLVFQLVLVFQAVQRRLLRLASMLLSPLHPNGGQVLQVVGQSKHLWAGQKQGLVWVGVLCCVCFGVAIL